MQSGVLALQGDFEPHAEALRRLGHEPVLVRNREQLARVTHLVLPGGESTTLHHLLELFDLRSELVARQREGSLALFGTCAGAILLGRGDGAPPRLALLDAELARNAFGRQIDSFSAEIELDGAPLDAVFIRAPRFVSIGSQARVLATLRGEPVAVEGPRLLATTFHPELTSDPRLHARFLAMPVAQRAVELRA